ncbi:MAG: two-component system, chemotaxis family, CheB/CheR fusion protein [Blastocatellia bacterium]|jgi:two-component system CheB/CheR fusion protein|nr:two-component system, chemotaxis family, CheB/CheR fusion protein [Blastocatellia bacterium]
MQTTVIINQAHSHLSTETLSLSTNTMSGSDVPPPEGSARISEAEEAVKSKPRALVVDDVADVMEMIALFLRHAGYEVMMAACGPDALEVARSEQFDIIVSDIGMPGMNGYELAQALRALPHCSTVPMIAVTGFSVYDDKGRALQCGFNAHLTKPINPMALLELIERLRN